MGQTRVLLKKGCGECKERQICHIRYNCMDPTHSPIEAKPLGCCHGNSCSSNDRCLAKKTYDQCKCSRHRDELVYIHNFSDCQLTTAEGPRCCSVADTSDATSAWIFKCLALVTLDCCMRHDDDECFVHCVRLEADGNANPDDLPGCFSFSYPLSTTPSRSSNKAQNKSERGDVDEHCAWITTTEELSCSRDASYKEHAKCHGTEGQVARRSTEKARRNVDRWKSTRWSKCRSQRAISSVGLRLCFLCLFILAIDSSLHSSLHSLLERRADSSIDRTQLLLAICRFEADIDGSASCVRDSDSIGS